MSTCLHLSSPDLCFAFSFHDGLPWAGHGRAFHLLSSSWNHRLIRFLYWYCLQCIAMARVWIWKIPNIDLFGFWIAFPPIVIVSPIVWSFVRNQDLVFTARILNRHLFRNSSYFSLFSQLSVDMKKWKWEPKNICFRINQRCVHCALSYQDLHSSIFMRKIPRVV